MEPAAVGNRIGLSSVALTALLLLGACQRAADTPARTGTSRQVPATERQSPTSRPEDRPREEPSPDVEPAVAEPAVAEPEPQSQPAEDTATEGEADRATEAAPVQPQSPAEEEAESQPEPAVPLVDDPENLEPLQPNQPIWITRDRSSVVMVGRVCQRRAPLELFACLKGSKEHESVVAVETDAYVVHAGLLLTGAQPGGPVRFDPEFVPASGTEIEVTLIWVDQDGRRRRARAQDWVRDVAELYSMFDGVAANQFDDELNVGDQPAAWKEMEYAWVFAGSQLLKDDRTGEPYYLADAEGELICVSNFPSAVLDVPVRSSDSNAALLFEAFTERIPPLGTPVTLVLTPKLGKPPVRPTGD